MGKPLNDEIVDQLTERVIDTTIISLSSKSTFGGLLTSIYGWLTQTGSAVFIGILITILGFILNQYFQIRKTRRDNVIFQQTIEAHQRAEERKEELHRARLEAISRSTGGEICE